MKNEMILAGDSYTDSQIVSGTVVLVQSLDGNELQYDTLDATLDLGGWIPTLFKPADADGLMTSEGELLGVRPLIRILVADPTSYRYGATVLYKHNGALVGKYYMTNMKKVGKTQYSITCVSPVGLLANSKHYGGIYAGTRFSALIGEIIGGVVPFSVAPELADQPVYGWLPIAPRRDNLHQALFAMGAAAQKDANGDLYISPLSDDLVVEIPDSRIYTGGSLSYPDTVTQVAISEHSYVANTEDEVVTLHEGIVEGDQITTPNGTATTGTVVLFTEPMHDLAVENGTIVESGVNYAVLAPAADCKLTGRKYTHTMREVTRPETVSVEDTENKLSVTDATLVSVANSENVADRLMAYYSSAKTLSTDFVVGTERAGSAVQINDPFGDATKGIITSMDITMSNTLKARAEIVSDYSPGNAGNFYSNVVVITASGYWIVPEDVKKIRVVVIGGGDGGEAGLPGSEGQDGQAYNTASAIRIYRGEPGDGGKPGAGGQPGKVTVGSISVQEGDRFTVSIGKGGAGAVYGGAAGSGEDSTFGDLTSADGNRPGSSGYVSLFDGGVYAIPGKAGIAGGRGQEAGTSTGSAGERPTVEHDGGTWQAGDGGAKAGGTITSPSYSLLSAAGGAGGGAAVGRDGNVGNDAIFEKDADGSGFVIGGRGGNGSTPVKSDTATIPGSGGQGGHGGGGGGGGGSYGGSTGAVGRGGNPGNGGEAGDGAPGCVLIYY